MNRTGGIIAGLLMTVAMVFLQTSMAWAASCQADCDCEGVVNLDDLAIMKTEYFNACDPCPPPAPDRKTGQTVAYATGDDRDLQRGVSWPIPRFTDNTDGTVTDNLTSLVWLKDANCMLTHYPGFDTDYSPDGKVTWQHALDFVAGINSGAYPDRGAGNTDWRLPNRQEMESLIHLKFYDPALPDTAGTGKWSEDDPFTGVHSDYYLSSSISMGTGGQIWFVQMRYGYALFAQSYFDAYLWPVRGGQ